MNIVGLGHAGCQIAKNFKEYQQYNVFCVDIENKKYPKFLKVKEQKTHESYEKNYKKLNFDKCKGPTTLILSGAGKISGCCLRILEQLKENEITILYIKSDTMQLSSAAAAHERSTFGVLQQYTRSALFSKMYIVANNNVEKIIEDISLKNYWVDINHIISSTYHMVNVFKNTEPLLSNQAHSKETARISTMGVVNYETSKEKLFYDLQYPRTRKYFYGLASDTTESDKDTLHNIRKFVEGRSGENINSGFSLYSTNYSNNYVYSEHCASFIQEQIVE